MATTQHRPPAGGWSTPPAAGWYLPPTMGWYTPPNTGWYRWGDYAWYSLARRPTYDRRERLTPLPVFELLPRTNCRKCGLPTCLAFALEVAAERLSVIRCGPLFDAVHQPRRRRLLELLVAAGYEVPSAFRPQQDG